MDRMDIKLLLVVLLGCACIGDTQKTFRRSCDCEYMVDGKCAYTLLLPTQSPSGENCPTQESGSGDLKEMSDKLANDMNGLESKYADLQDKYVSQATVINQLYSTLMDKLMSCPLLQQCMVSDQNTPPTAMPSSGDDDMSLEGTTTTGAAACSCGDVERRVARLQEEIGVYRDSLSAMNTSLSQAGDMTMVMEMLQEMNATVLELMDQLTGMVIGQAMGQDDGSQGNQPPFQPPADGQLPPFDQQEGPPPARPQDEIDGISGMISELLNPLVMQVTSTLSNFGSVFQSFVDRGAICARRGLLISGEYVQIADDAITSSSVFNEEHFATRVRINTEAEGTLKGAWCPEEPNTPGDEWIQFDLGRPRVVYGVVTRGRSDYEQWVESYKVHYSTELNEEDPDQTVWTPVEDMLGLGPVIFVGNKNQNSPKFNYFDNAIVARYFRIIPLSGYEGQNMCMRADLIGCIDEPISFQ